MFAERQKGISCSAMLHLVVLLLVIFGLPSLLNKERVEEPSAITVELLPISTISNVKPSTKQAPEEKPAEEKEQAKPAPPVKSAEASVPPPPPEKPAEVKKPKEAEKPKEKPKDDKKADKKKKEEDLAAVLKAVKDTAQKEKEKDKKIKDKDGGGKSISNQYDPTMPLSISEEDAIRSQIAKCWSVPAGAKDAFELIVVLRLEVAKDGSVVTVEMTSETKTRYARDTFYRAATDSAIRAVRQCSPLKNLPVEKYATWRDMELTFDPKEMLF